MSRLDRRITIRSRAAAQDAWGGPSDTWSDIMSVWASFTPLSDGERWQAGQAAATAMARFQTHYSAALAARTTADRIHFDGKDWNILGIKEIGRRRRLEFTAVWTDSDGA